MKYRGASTVTYDRWDDIKKLILPGSPRIRWTVPFHTPHVLSSIYQPQEIETSLSNKLTTVTWSDRLKPLNHASPLRIGPRFPGGLSSIHSRTSPGFANQGRRSLAGGFIVRLHRDSRTSTSNWELAAEFGLTRNHVDVTVEFLKIRNWNGGTQHGCRLLLAQARIPDH